MLRQKPVLEPEPKPSQTGPSLVPAINTSWQAECNNDYRTSMKTAGNASMEWTAPLPLESLVHGLRLESKCFS